MPTEVRFRTLFPSEASPRGETTVALSFDGRALQAPFGCSVAAALLASGVSTFRTTPVSGAPRAPYCMMGVCFDCLVTIDGVASEQACLVRVCDGMRIERSRSLPEVQS